jgi:hypothetical protein
MSILERALEVVAVVAGGPAGALAVAGYEANKAAEAAANTPSPLVDKTPNAVRFDAERGKNAQGTGIFDGEMSKYYCTLSFGPYKRPKPFESAAWSPDLTICLPLPNELTDNIAPEYDNQSLGAVGDIINGALTGAVTSSLLRNSGDILVGAGKGLAGGVGGAVGGEVGNKITEGLENMLPDAATVTSAVQQSQGLAPNPNPSVMFKGPQLREYTYNWTIFPDSIEQSKALRNMIKVIKGRVLPKSAGSSQASVLHYPNMVQMNFFPWDGTGAGNPWGWGVDSFIRIKKCVVKSFNTNYTPSNVPAFFEGEGSYAVAVNVSITLQEIEYMLANDWIGDDGFGPEVGLATLGTAAKGIYDSTSSVARGGFSEIATALGQE